MAMRARLSGQVGANDNRKCAAGLSWDTTAGSEMFFQVTIPQVGESAKSADTRMGRINAHVDAKMRRNSCLSKFDIVQARKVFERGLLDCLNKIFARRENRYS